MRLIPLAIVSNWFALAHQQPPLGATNYTLLCTKCKYYNALFVSPKGTNAWGGKGSAAVHQVTKMRARFARGYACLMFIRVVGRPHGVPRPRSKVRACVCHNFARSLVALFHFCECAFVCVCDQHANTARRSDNERAPLIARFFHLFFSFSLRVACAQSVTVRMGVCPHLRLAAKCRRCLRTPQHVGRGGGGGWFVCVTSVQKINRVSINRANALVAPCAMCILEFRTALLIALPSTAKIIFPCTYCSGIHRG